MTTWACLACSAEFDSRPPVCGVCLDTGTLVMRPMAVGGRPVAAQPRRRGGIVAAATLRPDLTSAGYPAPWSEWSLPARHAILLYGPPGGGKSTAATALAIEAARRGPVLYVAAEEGHAASLVQRLERLGLDDLTGRRLRVSDARDPFELVEDLEADPKSLVILDSVSELRLKPAAGLELLGARSWVAVQHFNSRGGAHGGLDWSHAVDLVARVEAGTLTTTKNRFGSLAEFPVPGWRSR
ncbi:MAG: hypothetical protein RI900_2815 [Actinomycetota bacterium]